MHLRRNPYAPASYPRNPTPAVHCTISNSNSSPARGLPHTAHCHHALPRPAAHYTGPARGWRACERVSTAWRMPPVEVFQKRIVPSACVWRRGGQASANRTPRPKDNCNEELFRAFFKSIPGNIPGGNPGYRVPQEAGFALLKTGRPQQRHKIKKAATRRAQATGRAAARREQVRAQWTPCLPPRTVSARYEHPRTHVPVSESFLVEEHALGLELVCWNPCGAAGRASTKSGSRLHHSANSPRSRSRSLVVNERERKNTSPRPGRAIGRTSA